MNEKQLSLLSSVELRTYKNIVYIRMLKYIEEFKDTLKLNKGATGRILN